MKNPVAKYARKFNKSNVMKDRKKAMKKGDRKHKGKYEDAQQTDTANRTNAAAKKPQNYTDKDGKQKTRMVPAHQDVQNEKLNPSMGIKAYIDDFQKSDAPQFQGKSAKKRREMAIAAYMDAKKGMSEASDPKRAELYKKYREASARKDKETMDKIAKAIAAYNKVHPTLPKGTSVQKEDAEARARLKLKHAKEKENMKNRHTKEREAMKEEDVKENYRASRALSHASNKMYGRQHPEQDKPKTGVTKQAKSGKAAKADLFRALDKKYGDPKKKTGIYAKEETMDPRDYTDEPGHLVVVTKPNGKKSINYFHKTHAGAKKRADQINKRVRIPGHKATVHKTDGRKIHEEVEQVDELSKKTLGSYIKKSTASAADHSAKSSAHTLAKNIAGFSSDKSKHAKTSDDHRKKVNKRTDGIERAANKLTKDKNKSKYIKKSAYNAVDHAKHAGVASANTRTSGDRHHQAAKAHAGEVKKRYKGISRMTNKLAKEEVEQFDEASQKLANKRAELRKKMFGDANYLSPAQRKELDKAAKAELKKDSAKKKAAPAPKTTTKTAKGKTHTGRADPADQNIFMQMRKAQDAAKVSGAKMHTLKVGPKSTVSVPTSLVNKALAKHDSLKKPEDKRRLKIQLIKALRAKAK